MQALVAPRKSVSSRGDNPGRIETGVRFLGLGDRESGLGIQ